MSNRFELCIHDIQASRCGHCKPPEPPPEVRQCPHGNPLTSYCGSCDDDGWHAATKQNALAQPPEVPRHCPTCDDAGCAGWRTVGQPCKPEVPCEFDPMFGRCRRTDAHACSASPQVPRVCAVCHGDKRYCGARRGCKCAPSTPEVPAPGDSAELGPAELMIRVDDSGLPLGIIGCCFEEEAGLAGRTVRYVRAK